MQKRLIYYDIDLAKEVQSEYDFLKKLQKNNPVGPNQTEETGSQQVPTNANTQSKLISENKSNQDSNQDSHKGSKNINDLNSEKYSKEMKSNPKDKFKNKSKLVENN